MAGYEWKGADFSHWNKDALVNDVARGCEFIVHKLTEGTNVLDAKAAGRVRRYADEKATIVYHVLTKESAEAQYRFFKEQYENVRRSLTKGRLGVAIDIESAYFPTTKTTDLMKRLLDFGNSVERELGVRPIVYIGDLYKQTVYDSIRTRDWLLWLARYCKKGNVKHSCDMWQWTSSPYDKDVLYGSVDKLHSILNWKR